jgi:hypothetical protein
MSMQKIEHEIGDVEEYLKNARKWRTPNVEAHEQNVRKQEEQLSKTAQGRVGQRKRGLY